LINDLIAFDREDAVMRECCGLRQVERARRERAGSPWWDALSRRPVTARLMTGC